MKKKGEVICDLHGVGRVLFCQCWGQWGIYVSEISAR